jgi:hypothetical protein
LLENAVIQLNIERVVTSKNLAASPSDEPDMTIFCGLYSNPLPLMAATGEDGLGRKV